MATKLVVDHTEARNHQGGGRWWMWSVCSLSDQTLHYVMHFKGKTKRYGALCWSERGSKSTLRS